MLVAPMREPLPNRRDLLDRIGALRCEIREEIGVASLAVLPTRACDRLVSGLLDSLNGLEALLRAATNE